MKDEIMQRFESNLSRVRHLVTAYEGALPGTQGRPSVATTDILRAAVVFLHAALEDLLRALLEWKLPLAKAEQLDDVQLLGEKLRKYTLADFAKHRGSTVDDVVARSVRFSLERSNFNSVQEVAAALVKANVDQKIVDPYASHLEAMMKRRHWIVHRADRNDARGLGQFPARSLHPATVKTWLASVESFAQSLLALL